MNHPKVAPRKHQPLKSNLLDLLLSAKALKTFPHSQIPKGATPNKYQPHQGKRECARRVAKGIKCSAN